MKVSNHPQSKIRAKLSAYLPLSSVRNLAAVSEFCVRAARKIDPLSFVLSFFMSCASRNVTLSNWAAQLCLLNGGTSCADVPTKQAICKRPTKARSESSKALLMKLLVSRISTEIGKTTRGNGKGKGKGEAG